MRKEKKMPGSKKENKYIGPMVARNVTESHALVQKGASSKLQKVPLHISKTYHPRSSTPTFDIPSKKVKMDDQVISDDVFPAVEIPKIEGTSIPKWRFGISRELIANKLEELKVRNIDIEHYLSKIQIRDYLIIFLNKNYNINKINAKVQTHNSSFSRFSLIMSSVGSTYRSSMKNLTLISK